MYIPRSHLSAWKPHSLPRNFLLRLLLFVIVALASWPGAQPRVYAQAAPACDPKDSSAPLAACIAAPANGATLTGDAPVSLTVNTPGKDVRVRRIVSYLDGEYLLTAFENPATFVLPTARWADGEHTLSVEAVMHGDTTTPRTSITLLFQNGVNSPRVNRDRFQPRSGRPAAPGAPFVVAASGDGASGEAEANQVADLVASINPNLFLYLGDVYEKGSPVEFYNWYGTPPSLLGRLRSITNPTVGNHEYENGQAVGYFDYWDNVASYYSFNAGGWHFVSLNSNVRHVRASAGSQQFAWLNQDLAAQPAGACTVVYYHHPLFNIGKEGPEEGMRDAWRLMAERGVDIVLNGHDHTYQRWTPMDASGEPSAEGITEFVVGTAGHSAQAFVETDPRVEFSADGDNAFGVLLLQLTAAGAEFSYRTLSGIVLDSGVIPCASTGIPVTGGHAGSRHPYFRR